MKLNTSNFSKPFPDPEGDEADDRGEAPELQSQAVGKDSVGQDEHRLQLCAVFPGTLADEGREDSHQEAHQQPAQ